ncbi:hypothetical protein SynBIOSE41_02736 [Synechococcus sp. BIOS-E4-1]|nr:hypothetical protein SynBIOSE41_02736 [Synechococcus sp. BIOS-E4-1]
MHRGKDVAIFCSDKCYFVGGLSSFYPLKETGIVPDFC